MSGAITAVVPVWNRRELAAKVIATIAAQTAGVERIIVVDNGSTDGAAECAEAAGAHVIRMGRNAGFAPAVNRGIAEANSEWVAVVNNDVELAPDYFALLLEAAREESAWFATGKILQARNPGTIDATFDILCRGGCSWRMGFGEPDGPAFSSGRRIFSTPWTASLFRRSLFVDVGVLEERFESYLEDVDFGARCAVANRSGLYVPAARAWHLGSATLGAWSPRMVRLIARNQVWIAARHLCRRDAWHVIVAQLLWGLVALRHGTGSAWVLGKLEGLRTNAPLSTNSFKSSMVLREWLRDNERSIRTAQSRYWRVYSLLTPAEAM
jgi:GT2 family glycosyltransferase